MTPGEHPRVFIGLVEIAGYASRLRDGFETLGLRAVQVDLSSHPFGYPRAQAPLIVRITERVASARAQAKANPRAIRLLWTVAELIARSALLAWAIARFDVFIFVFNSGFLRRAEMPILRWLGKRQILLFVGSDTRPPYMDGYDLAGPVNPRALLTKARAKKSLVRRSERFGSVSICNPASAQFFEGPVVGFTEIGIPIPSAMGDLADVPRSDGIVRVLHAPSHAMAKGTPAIRAAIESLRDSGLVINYIEIAGQSTDVVRRQLAECDFVVDQLYSDTPMAGFATEAAAMGKAAVVGGLDWEEVLRHITPALIPPTHRCHPDEIEDALRQLILDAPYRIALGRRAREFVHQRWTSEEVARRYLQLIRGDAPAEWFHDPNDVTYADGSGVTPAKRRLATASMIRDYGVESFLVSDKPRLQSRLIPSAVQNGQAPLGD